jgi:putative hydrolase
VIILDKETQKEMKKNQELIDHYDYLKNARENVLQMLELCKQYEVCVTTGSDAHIDVDAGNFSYIKEVLEFCKFPEELVVTTDFNKLKEFLNNYKES